jgi:hypothetical protein
MPLSEARRLNLREIVLQPVAAHEEGRFQALMEAHHYLGALPKIGHTLWYVATWNGEWLALLSFSAAAWKCAARDAWIGWDFRRQYDRLHLVANNSRFLILPEYHVANLASRVLALSERRLASDWRERFGYSLQGHRPVGRRPGPEGAGALSLLLPQRSLRGAQSYRHPRGAHPR